MQQADRDAWSDREDDLPARLAAARDAAIIECACGTVLPAYVTEFEPQCRFCERTHLNRGIRLLEELEEVNEPATRRRDGPSTTATTLGQFAE